jgi:hypothetical protein
MTLKIDDLNEDDMHVLLLLCGYATNLLMKNHPLYVPYVVPEQDDAFQLAQASRPNA